MRNEFDITERFSMKTEDHDQALNRLMAEIAEDAKPKVSGKVYHLLHDEGAEPKATIAMDPKSLMKIWTCLIDSIAYWKLFNDIEDKDELIRSHPTGLMAEMIEEHGYDGLNAMGYEKAQDLSKMINQIGDMLAEIAPDAMH